MAAARCPSLVLMLLLSCTCYGAASAAADGKLIHLHFYFHEVRAGAPNATVVSVVSLNNKSAGAFGDVKVLDNELREGPDPESRLIGRAQGFGVNASLDGSSYFSAIDFVFSGDDGEYSGSTVSAQGRFDPTGRRTDERSIVGGTGKLRFARGYMTSRILSSTNSYLVAVFDMYLTLAH
ncbi:hypothetical protein BDA96_05G171200 [Sorghum bicolor]|uniref:Dirigent protein n=2 Tax=Sorghum bicolor TaxID=4558 RepID=A0A921QYE7_SORBI|nr:dirigent protein 1 [Sorghum bicolor]KAG0530266.1 hypothetical protein BDA96_05G171200 [Sorghum bicolor]OQU83676.1 hypothetical protein SORBI_3005G159100 [Sorghum bicolor]|eukprot:XP_002450987.1 dirigent protein 1 [Sorghum bicolor]